MFSGQQGGNVSLFLDKQLLDRAQEEARKLVKSGENQAVFGGFNPSESTRFHLRREAGGMLALAQVRVGGHTFFLGVSNSD